MVSAGVSAIAASGAFAAVPVVGWAVAIGAGLFDAYVIQPQLQGKRRNAARAPRLLDAPVGSNEAGAPRCWAIGRRVRVPTHILFQKEKVRESTAGSNKSGMAVPQRKTFVDALLAVNDRRTLRLVQLAGNGKLLLFRTRNLVSVESATMTVSVSGGRVIITAGSTLDPDFADKLRVNDAVQLSGFVMSSGVNLNTGYWKIAAVVPHTSTPSRIELAPYSAQTVAGIAATAGNAFAPATVTRVDDVLFVEGSGTNILSPAGKFWRFDTGTNTKPEDVFDVEQDLIFEGFSNGAAFTVNGPLWKAAVRTGVTESQILCNYTPPPITSGGVSGGGPTNPGIIRPRVVETVAPGFFPTDFDPDLFFQDGSETQVASPLLVDAKGIANSPGYRGVAVQGVEQFFVTQFGDQLPFSLEAVIDPDQVMDWGTALATILRERAGIPGDAIDVTGVDPVPFLGFYLRGPVEAATALQPLLIAGQIVGQERDGKIALFNIKNADVVRIENGPAFTHFAARLDGEQPQDDKVQIEDTAEEDLPTSVGVRHQDPDNQYADGYQQFGLRNPEGIDHENRQELDLSNLVLTRKDARNLAATTTRRAWVNRRTFRATLTAHYLHLLENDLVTWTDDDGNDFTARIIQRDIGSDFRVAITAVEEDVQLAVAGSPVQSAAGDPPPSLRSAAPALRVVVIDAPAVDDEQTQIPAIGLAVCAEPGATWGGAQVWESRDGGANWGIVGSISEQAGIGSSIDSIGAVASAESVGEAPAVSTNLIRVDWASYGPQPITPSTEDDAKAGESWFLIVHEDGTQEVASWIETEFVEGTTWDILSSYRGLRGTRAVDSATATIVRLAPVGHSGIFWRQFPGAVTAKQLLYKVVPFGASFDDVEAIGVTAQWRNVLPLPVRSVARTIVGGNDAQVRVAHAWNRAVQPVGSQPPHAMDEPFEAYQFDFYTADGSKIARTKTLTAQGTGSPTLRDKWVTYTAAEQTQDGYTPGPSVALKVMVRQIGQFGLGPGQMVTVGP